MNTKLDILSGDCLEVTLMPLGESVVKEVWVSMLWTPSIGATKIQSLLVEELEKNIEEVALEIAEGES